MIVASMSTIPERKEHFKTLVRRILHEQTVPVQKLVVCLHRYESISPDLPRDSRLEYFLSKPDQGPWVRYTVAERLADDDILVTLDDDTIYPANYIEKGIADLHRKGENAVVCYGGLRWSPLVDEYEYYGSTRKIILGDTPLERDFRVSVLQGICSFMRARDAKGSINLQIPGFNTNDDLMISHHLQKTGRIIYSCTKPGGWIQQTGDSQASHALAVYDKSVRRETFHRMVYQLGFDPSAGWLEEFLSSHEQVVVLAATCPMLPEGLILHEKILRLCGEGASVHVIAPVKNSSIPLIQSLVDMPYTFHPSPVMDDGGRFESVPLVQQWRQRRIERRARDTWKRTVSAIERKLGKPRIVDMRNGIG